MYRKSAKLKKTLTKSRVLEVLEIIGLSSVPLSAYEVTNHWEEKYTSVKNSLRKSRIYNTNYIYELIKRLYKPGQVTHSERFLAKSYKENVQNEILALEKKFDLLQVKPGQTRSRKMSADEISEFDRAVFRIDNLKKNHRNWRYSLNLKGLLLYLYNADKFGRGSRTIYIVFSNVANRKIAVMDMQFLHDFEIFPRLYNIRTLVEILTQIAVELKDLLPRMTPKFLRDYIITRCYEEVAIDIAMNNNIMLKLTKQVNEERLKLLQNYKMKILNDLIPIEKEKLKEMEEELRMTKEATV